MAEPALGEVVFFNTAAGRIEDRIEEKPLNE
jgi:hypothetical protein